VRAGPNKTQKKKQTQEDQQKKTARNTEMSLYTIYIYIYNLVMFFPKKIAKSVVLTLGFKKSKKFPIFLSPPQKKTLLSTQLKKLQKLKNSFSKSCLRKFQAPIGGTREKFPPLYKSEPVLN